MLIILGLLLAAVVIAALAVQRYTVTIRAIRTHCGVCMGVHGATYCEACYFGPSRKWIKPEQ